MSNNQFSEYLHNLKEQIDTPSDDIRENVISEGIANLRSKISEVEVDVQENVDSKKKPEVKSFDKLGLADRAINTYKTKIAPPKDDASDSKRVGAVDQPCTMASRELMKATIRSLSNRRGSGDAGQPSPVASDSCYAGNTGTPNTDYYANVASLSLEDYKQHIFGTFGLLEEESPEEVEEVIERISEELDLIAELEDTLLNLEDRSWQSVDKATREVCLEHAISLRELNKEFKGRHGQYPDKWIREQVEVEECGWFPLDEVARVYETGMVYEVTYLFRGKTARHKFFWPSPQRPTREEMQEAVEKFYPRATLIAYYPARDQGSNYMIMVPPVSENYEFVEKDEWVALPEHVADLYEYICNETGEPQSSIFLDEENNCLGVEVSNHDTGESEVVHFAHGVDLECMEPSSLHARIK